MIRFEVRYKFTCDECGAIYEAEHRLFEGQHVPIVDIPTSWSRVNHQIFCPLHDVRLVERELLVALGRSVIDP